MYIYREDPRTGIWKWIPIHGSHPLTEREQTELRMMSPFRKRSNNKNMNDPAYCSKCGKLRGDKITFVTDDYSNMCQCPRDPNETKGTLWVKTKDAVDGGRIRIEPPEGWKCPRCARVWAPWVDQCLRCNFVQDSTDCSIKEHADVWQKKRGPAEEELDRIIPVKFAEEELDRTMVWQELADSSSDKD